MGISSIHTAYIAASTGQPYQGTGPGRVGEHASLPPNPRVPGDITSLSPEGLTASRRNSSQEKGKAETPSPLVDEKIAFTAEELKQLVQLKSRDREVRSHEQAHLAVAGQYASGGASYTYQRGPDGNSYATGGEVPIDIGGEPTPEATIQKMRTVRRAALAPAEPSGADRQIAAQASAKEMQARQELAQELQEDLSGVLSADIGSKTEGASQTRSDDDASRGRIADSSYRKMMITAYQRMDQQVVY